MTLDLKFMPVLDRLRCCCYSFSLKSGTIFTGIVVMIIDVISIIIDAVALAHSKGVEASTIFETTEFGVCSIVMAAIEFVTCGLLVYGAWKEKPSWMLPQIILQFSTLVMTTILMVVMCVFAFMETILAGFLGLIAGTFIIGMYFYTLVVSYSYYRQLESRLVVPNDAMSFREDHPTNVLHANAA